MRTKFKACKNLKFKNKLSQVWKMTNSNYVTKFLQIQIW